MTSDPQWNTRTFALVSLLFLLAQDIAYGWPNSLDPTVPSSMITERLDRANKSMLPTQEKTDVKKLAPKEIRLLAIVLRTRESGTAILSLGGRKKYVVRLRRSIKNNQTNHLNIRGIPLRAIDFSAASVTLQRLDTKEQFVIK